jgi:hypothetical protein
MDPELTSRANIGDDIFGDGVNVSARFGIFRQQKAATGVTR